ncbi:MAG: DNA repair protein RadA [Acidobacteria bacterium]|nr:DNA repair protein RadA [Acidobacteriota bacterium]MYG74357.1 DNA repair protein RadA [Acidobacteriota bacterium]
MPKRSNVRFVCVECGQDYSRWMGYCPSCSSQTPLVEREMPPEDAAGGRWRGFAGAAGAGAPVSWNEVDTRTAPRRPLGIAELDRVLGGGVVPGSAVLVAGEPGAGKSTLLLQLAAAAAASGAPVLYVSGEESEHQLKLRGERLGLEPDSLLLFAETSMPRILDAAQSAEPGLLVLDSVQCVHSPEISGAPGTVTQVRESAASLVLFAKSTRVPVFIIGHVNKDGAIAGPRTLEHMVDTVLHFEGDRRQSHRLLRAVKNRFGAAGELGVFDMTGQGLVPVRNPSELFLTGGPPQPGAAVVCTLKGTRPLLAEIQVLLAESPLAYPRRVPVGFDSGRLAVLLAVLETGGGGGLLRSDVYVSVTGGLTVNEPAADLGLLAAVVSRRRGVPVPPGTVFIGEVGLSGEVRPVHQAGVRLREAARLGYRRAVVNPGKARAADWPADIDLVAAESLDQALAVVGQA